ncbi:hypothetical protein MTO96_002007 [Rhipicephalus appendiculatus]
MRVASLQGPAIAAAFSSHVHGLDPDGVATRAIHPAVVRVYPEYQGRRRHPPPGLRAGKFGAALSKMRSRRVWARSA